MMRLVVLFLAVLIVWPAPAGAADAEQAPFGLRWGATAAELRAQGVKLGLAEQREWGGNLHLTKMVPRPLAGAYTYMMGFDIHGRMFAVGARLGPWKNTEELKGIQRFDALKSALGEKYSEVSSENDGGDIYADFENPFVDVYLFLEKGDGEEGSTIILGYTHKEMGAAMNKARDARKEKARQEQLKKDADTL